MSWKEIHIDHLSRTQLDYILKECLEGTGICCRLYDVAGHPLLSFPDTEQTPAMQPVPEMVRQIALSTLAGQPPTQRTDIHFLTEAIHHQQQMHGVLVGWLQYPASPAYPISLAKRFMHLARRRIEDALTAEKDMAGLSDEILENYRELEFIHALSMRLAGLTHIHQVYQLTLEQLCEILEADAGGIFTLEPATHHLQLVQTYPVPPEAVPTAPVPLGEGLIGTVAQTGQSILIEDNQQPWFKTPPDFPFAPPLMCCPLQMSQEPLGVLVIARDATKPVFTARDLKILESTARQSVAAMMNVRLLEHLKRSNDELQHEIAEHKRAQETQTKLEAQLRQAQKMEAIGTLAGGIAHDFNNLLTPIRGYAEITRNRLSQDSRLQAYMDRVLGAADRAADLVRQILTFSRQREQQKKPVQIHFIVKEVLKLVRASLPATIEIRPNIDTNAGTVIADPTQIHQVIMNLCTNAYHSMRERCGVLEINLETVNLDTNFVKTRPNLSAGSHILLTISDTGHGMDQATMGRIFDPFFTTKAVGEGTGLGLSVVHAIVMEHEGDIAVESELGRGTTFSVYLPQTDFDVKRSAQGEDPLPRGTERILFVDDEETIAWMGKEMLQPLGYNVTVKTSSIEALRAFGAHPDRFDLVITDLTMPHLTGDQLAKELMRIRPAIPIILATGFSETLTPEKAKEIGIREYLTKPIAVRKLSEAIRQALGQ